MTNPYEPTTHTLFTETSTRPLYDYLFKNFIAFVATFIVVIVLFSIADIGIASTLDSIKKNNGFLFVVAIGAGSWIPHAFLFASVRFARQLGPVVNGTIGGLGVILPPMAYRFALGCVPLSVRPYYVLWFAREFFVGESC